MVFLKISQISQENSRPKARNFIKKRIQHRCFPVEFTKFLRTPILKNVIERLLLNSARHSNGIHYIMHVVILYFSHSSNSLNTVNINTSNDFYSFR